MGYRYKREERGIDEMREEKREKRIEKGRAERKVERVWWWCGALCGVN